MPQKLELLAPAKDAIHGREAINHGADALYIGPPAFGARVAAGNSLQDIEQLVNYAHLYHAKVYVTVNTLLYDNEMEAAAQMIHQLYAIGVDAILIQDMGLLQCDLPPIELHASTQTHNASVERVRFLQDVGFKRVVLARETSLQQMAEIRKATNVELEAFIQGALCVSYSGQCYMSEYLTGRSGNRGCCTQPCRSSYDLLNSSGKVLRQNEHLLSLRDFSAAQHIGAMADTGIISFKIEGRLKDMTYVKNLTAYYRQLLDNMMAGNENYTHASSGRCTFFFTPDLERTFNRGFTDYFLQKRQPMASFATQKAIGKKVGTVSEINSNSLVINSNATFTAGDGLCFIDNNTMQGFLVNRAEGNRLFPNKMPQIKIGTVLFRNNDVAFEKELQKKSAERKIAVNIIFSNHNNVIILDVTDEEGYTASAHIEYTKTLATNVERARQQIAQQLTKLGDTCYELESFSDTTSEALFIPASVLNQLRRSAIEQLNMQRLKAAQPLPTPRIDNGQASVAAHLDYSYNVINGKAEAFYKKHGATTIESGIEVSHDFDDKALMTTKYCLRYELGQCLNFKNNDSISPDYRGALFLRNNQKLFLLQFDCNNCQMKIYCKKR